MKRLTKRTNKFGICAKQTLGSACCEGACYKSETCDTCPIEKVFNRLAAYEDTGMESWEIAAMKADNERLHKLVDAVQTILCSKLEGDNADENA